MSDSPNPTSHSTVNNPTVNRSLNSTGPGCSPLIRPEKPDMAAFMRMMDVASEMRKQREIAGEQFEKEETREDLRKRLRATAEVTGESLTDAEKETLAPV